MVVLENSLKVEEQLKDEGVLQSQAPGLGSPIDQFPGEIAIAVDLVETELKEGTHDLLELLLSEGGGHEGVLDGFHDGGGEAVPGIISIDLLGSHRITPSGHLAFQVGSLCLHVAGGRDSGAEGLIFFQELMGGEALGRGAIWVENLSWLV